MATFEVRITFKGRPYAAEDIEEVKYLLFDAKSQLVANGAAQHAGEAWTLTFAPEVTRRLSPGSSRLEVIAVSRAVSIPSFATVSFTTLPR